MKNAGKYNRKIKIYNVTIAEDGQGIQTNVLSDDPVLSAYAGVKTTRGMTLIANGSDFEKAYTNFTIRFPHVAITRDMIVVFGDKNYTIEYINNVNEANVEIELQCKEITH